MAQACKHEYFCSFTLSSLVYELIYIYIYLPCAFEHRVSSIRNSVIYFPYIVHFGDNIFCSSMLHFLFKNSYM
jgi:hypothetical protein